MRNKLRFSTLWKHDLNDLTKKEYMHLADGQKA